jgi:hypothetical protein
MSGKRMNQINQFFRTYRWCVALAFAGGCAVATIAYNVMGVLSDLKTFPSPL